jgi:hypothetical protein
MRAAGDAVDDPADGFVATFRTALRWLDRHPFVRKSLELEPELLMPYLSQPDAPVLATAHDVFADLVRRGMASGHFRRVEPQDVAEVCWRLVLSFALSPTAVGGPLDDARIAALVRTPLLTGVLREAA